ncbi:MAG: hypothetical protein IIU69_08000, partial [Bacteroidaceae bacterium]|nr:hypothetical protein [Bacteroidaceae bacterium]
MKKLIALLITAFFYSATMLAQESMTVAFYNVENLFDTVDNPLTNDDEFTPDGDRHWNSSKYWDKLQNIS